MLSSNLMIENNNSSRKTMENAGFIQKELKLKKLYLWVTKIYRANY